MRRSQLLIGMLMVGLAGCTADTTGPRGSGAQRSLEPPRLATSSTSGPVFVQAAPGAPGIANPVVSFWARVDSTRSVTMSYTDGTPFLYFRVPKGALAARPDGTKFASHDSVLITATLTDTVHLIVDFEPSGLRFSLKHPATLKLYYQHTDPDLNGDGVVTAADSAIVSSFRIWKREASTDPWQALVTVENATIDELEASIFGFTSYGIAY